MTALGNEMFTQPWFDGDEQDVLAEYLAFTSSLGFPLQRDEFLCKVNVAVKEKANERGVKFTPLGRNWFYDFLKRDYCKELGLYTGKTSTSSYSFRICSRSHATALPLSQSALGRSS